MLQDCTVEQVNTNSSDYTVHWLQSGERVQSELPFPVTQRSTMWIMKKFYISPGKNLWCLADSTTDLPPHTTKLPVLHFGLIDFYPVERCSISLCICSTHPESLHGSLLLMLSHTEIVKMLKTLTKNTSYN